MRAEVRLRPHASGVPESLQRGLHGVALAAADGGADAPGRRPAGFRLAETPVFLTEELGARLEATARAIVAQVSDPALLSRMKRAIPAEWHAPGWGASRDGAGGPRPRRGPDGDSSPADRAAGLPLALGVRGLPGGRLERGPSEDPGLPAGPWSPYFSGLSRDSYLDLFRRTIVGREDPENVVLLDLHPAEQKTHIDFTATERLLGVASATRATSSRKDGGSSGSSPGGGSRSGGSTTGSSSTS